MVSKEVSGCLIVRGGKILLVSGENEDELCIPVSDREKGELSAETAERIAEEHTGCESEVVKYQKALKNKFEVEGEEVRLQPYSVELQGDPENAEWVRTEELESENLAGPVEQIAGDIADKF